jgi:hypothetical protein
MSEASPRPIDHFPAFLARIPSHIDLEALARAARAFQRPRGVRSGTDLLRLALAWGPGGYSMQRVAAWAGERNRADDPRHRHVAMVMLAMLCIAGQRVARQPTLELLTARDIIDMLKETFPRKPEGKDALVTRINE